MKVNVFSTLLLLSCLTACAGSGVNKDATAEAAIAAEAMVSRLTDIGGQQVEYWVNRVPDAHATLVFENGLMLPLTTWQRVTAALSSNSNMLAYNRPGVGRSVESDWSSDATRTVDQLWQLLQAQNLPPPYVLVGHSLGGQYAQLFAERYPDQVRAILLVDALPIGIVKPVEEFPWYTRWGLALFAPDFVQREVESIYPMGQTVLADTDRFAQPMIRLVAVSDPPPSPPQGLIKDLLNGVLYADDFGVWSIDPEQGECRMDELYPQSVVRQVPAVHRIQEVTPEAVIAAIHDLIKDSSGQQIQDARGP